MQKLLEEIENFKVEIDLEPVERAAEEKRSNDRAEYSDADEQSRALFEDGDYSLEVELKIPFYAITPRYRDPLTKEWNDFGDVEHLLLCLTSSNGKKREYLMNELFEGESNPLHYGDIEAIHGASNKIYTVTLERSKGLWNLEKNYD